MFSLPREGFRRGRRSWTSFRAPRRSRQPELRNKCRHSRLSPGQCERHQRDAEQELHYGNSYHPFPSSRCGVPNFVCGACGAHGLRCVQHQSGTVLLQRVGGTHDFRASANPGRLPLIAAASRSWPPGHGRFRHGGRDTREVLD
ncbi:hypothetical protein V5799_021482 [Amblyomma americanum]|uniref:Uncharacterized protein n=1 Tax=Amblyomma americanum TaxID=6943 RepID=A0AAQ4FPQ0_AMBAM